MNRSALASLPDMCDDARATVSSVPMLVRAGFTRPAIRAQLDARRWQRCGRAIVRHNSVLSFEEMARVGLLNCGQRAALTAFTGAELGGLRGWHRQAIHVLVPAGARVCRPPGVLLRVHWTGDWPSLRPRNHGDTMPVAHAVVAAAGTFESVRPACGILAAAVQQRLTRPSDLRSEVDRHERLRGHRLLLAALADIEGGAEALSEIDFSRLCRRWCLPEPTRQSIRRDRSGKRRYLDAEWRLADGRVVVVEVDGALHMVYEQWWDDALRQNEVTLANNAVLRYPSALVRMADETMRDQLTRALT